MGRIVRPHARRRAQIGQPEDVGIEGADRHGGLILRSRMAAFVGKGTVVAVGHAVQIQAHHFVPVGHCIDPIAFHRRRRADAGIGPIEIDIFRELRHHKLPGEAAVVFVQAQENAAVALVPRIARLVVDS